MTQEFNNLWQEAGYVWGKHVLLHVRAIQGHCSPCGRERAVVAFGADPALSDTQNISILCIMARGRVSLRTSSCKKD